MELDGDDNILDARLMKYFYEPQHAGKIEDSEGVRIVQGMGGSAALGRILQLFLSINEEQYITEVKFKAYGCGFTFAAAEWLSEWLQGKRINEALTMDRFIIAQELNLPSIRIYAAVLAEETLKAAIDHFLKGEVS